MADTAETGEEQGPERGRRKQSGPAGSGQAGPWGATELVTEETSAGTNQHRDRSWENQDRRKRRKFFTNHTNSHQVKHKRKPNAVGEAGMESGSSNGRVGGGAGSHQEEGVTTATQGRKGASRKHAEGQERPPCPPGPATPAHPHSTPAAEKQRGARAPTGGAGRALAGPESSRVQPPHSAPLPHKPLWAKYHHRLQVQREPEAHQPCWSSEQADGKDKALLWLPR